MAVVERDRPKKLFKATIAFGPYSKGAKLQPTGIYRDVLLRKGFIVEITEEEQQATRPAQRQATPLVNRQIGGSELANRKRR